MADRNGGTGEAAVIARRTALAQIRPGMRLGFELGVIACALCMSAGCFKEPSVGATGDDTGAGSGESGESGESGAESSDSTGGLTVPWGDRTLTSMIFADSETGYINQLVAARSMGMSAFRLEVSWPELRPDCNTAADTGSLSVLAFHEAVESDLVLEISPVDGGVHTFPADLPGTTALDDPAVIACYVDTVVAVVEATESRVIETVIVGSADEYVDASDENWISLGLFYEGVAQSLRAQVPGIRVGVMLTASQHILASPLAASLNANSDVIAVQIDPMDANFQLVSTDTVGVTLDLMAAIYDDGRRMHVYTGYPSTPLVGSSEQRQAQFVSETFAAWDAHVDQVELLSLGFVFDPPDSLTDGWQPLLKQYFGSMGLFSSEGDTKLAGGALVDAIDRRI